MTFMKTVDFSSIFVCLSTHKNMAICMYVTMSCFFLFSIIFIYIRYIAGQKEYEVELQFSSQLMSFPDRVKGAEEAVDGEQPIPGSSLSVDSGGNYTSNICQ